MTGRPSLLSAGLLLAFLAVVVHLASRSLRWPLIHDAPIMHYIAWRMTEGAVPYRDLFDMNFPGVYFLHLLVLVVLGPGDAGWRAFDLAWLATTSLAVAALAAPWGFVAAAGGALFFGAYHLAGGAWQAGQRDFLLSLFLLLGALGVTRWAERQTAGRPASSPPWGRRHTDLVWAGVVLGTGMAIKPHATVFAAALGIIVVAVAWRAGRCALAPTAAFGAGVALIPVAIVVGLGALGALAAWRHIVIDYLLPLYSRLGRMGAAELSRSSVGIPIAAAIVVSLGHVLWARRFSIRHGVMVAGLGYGLFHFLGQGKGWEYHLYPLAAFSSVLMFAELDALVRARRRTAAVAVAASIMAVAFWLNLKGAEASTAGWVLEKERRVAALVSDLTARRLGDEGVQVLDTTEGGVHALLRLRASQPTRFLYDFHFVHDVQQPVIRKLRAEFLDALGACPPRFVVLFERGWPTGGYERIESFSELNRWLAASYCPSIWGDGYILLERRMQAEGTASTTTDRGGERQTRASTAGERARCLPPWPRQGRSG